MSLSTVLCSLVVWALAQKRGMYKLNLPPSPVPRESSSHIQQTAEKQKLPSSGGLLLSENKKEAPTLNITALFDRSRCLIEVGAISSPGGTCVQWRRRNASIGKTALLSADLQIYFKISSDYCRKLGQLCQVTWIIL